ncbi:MAG: RIP metalloprotease RseP [Treponemataceae bacterium]|nr:RIP metalloprotease RseP [Treponemataceae bacterium]
MTIIYGLLGLDLLVIIHEFGHFLVAKWCGVIVESFSVGMGPVLLHKTIKGTDFRLSLIPLGGYCGLKGQEDFQIALNEKAEQIKGEPGSFYSIHPLKRVLIAFAGPFFNFLFAVIACIIIAMIGYSYYTSSNKIILASEIYPEIHSVAQESGLKTGDKIIAIDGKETPYFTDIYEIIAVNAQKELTFTVERTDDKNNTETFDLKITPDLNKETGGGVIGITTWTDTLIDEVLEDTPAWKAGLQAGDLITKVNGIDVNNTAEYRKIAKDKDSFEISVMRDGKEIDIGTIAPSVDEKGNKLIGIVFHAQKVDAKTYSFFPAIWQGTKEAFRNIELTFKGIKLLFKGIDITKAVSGPLRITVMLGDSAKDGFAAGFKEGVVTVLQFLSVISISLFIMNLLPIPILDGGLILFALIEAIFKKQISPKIQYYVQFVGIAILLVLFAVALFGDISYLIDKFKH